MIGQAKHIIVTGLKADIERMAAYDFRYVDEKHIEKLYTLVSIIKLSQKVLAEKVWSQCLESEGLSNYSRLIAYLEMQLGGRQKADLRIATQKTLSQKIFELQRFIAPPKVQLQETIRLNNQMEFAAFAV